MATGVRPSPVSGSISKGEPNCYVQIRYAPPIAGHPGVGAVVTEQNPRNSRRNLLPMKCINRSLLMGHEHVSRALGELMQIRQTPSGAARVLHDAPEAFDRI